MTVDDLIDRLVTEAEAIDANARLIQSQETEQALIDDVARRYRRWYAEAIEAVDDAFRAKFEDAYEGTTWTPRIKAFLADPLSVNPFWEPENPLGMSRWAHAYEQTFRESLHIQFEVLERSPARRGGTLGDGHAQRSCGAVPEAA